MQIVRTEGSIIRQSFLEDKLKFLRHPISEKSEFVFKMGIEGCAVDGRSIRNVVNGNRIDVFLFVEQIVKCLYKQVTGSLYARVARIYRHAETTLSSDLKKHTKRRLCRERNENGFLLIVRRVPTLYLLLMRYMVAQIRIVGKSYAEGKGESIMIIVTGANGKLGRGVVEQLLKRIPAEQIGVSVRDASQAQALEERGVRVRHGDFANAESLPNAFEGASQVLLVSTGILGDAGIRQHQIAIDAAKQSGAGRVLYTSHMGASSTSYFPPMVHHAATEELLKESGMRHASLRNGFYASSLVGLIGDAIQTGEWIVPEDGPVAWTTHSDLAEATAALLTEKNGDGPSPNLTASEAFDTEGVAAMVSDIVGRPIYRKVVTDEAYRAYLTAQGFPEMRVAITLGLFRASRNGDFAQTSNALADLIGRPPVTLRDFLKASLPR